MHKQGGDDGDAITKVDTGRDEALVKRFSPAGDYEDEDYHQWEGDVKKKQVFHGTMLLWVAYQATGVIYGDIGTSPLYVFSSTFASEPSWDDLVGALSLIIWSLTIIVTIKYVFIVLQADDEGEGGTFALFSLLSRYLHIVRRDPMDVSTLKMSRYSTNELGSSHKAVRTTVEESRFIKLLLSGLSIFGVTLVMADGVLTPAQSVLGAIQGIRVVQPDLSTRAIVGTSCAILVLLFVIQPFGVTKLTVAFSPIVVLWLLFNVVFGVYNLVKFDHTVLRAFSPYFAGAWFTKNGTEGWKALANILLCFTGCECLFADLGSFSKRAIQISWVCFAYPCLIIAYAGQAAYISRNEGAYSNPFFNTVPPGTFWPSLILSILAAIVASQATITATFQLLTQIMALNYFPKLKVVHTSTRIHGQVYIPFANWLLLIGCVIVTAVYNNTTSLGQAYGVCVILVTFITTCLVSIVAIVVWRMNILIVTPVFFIFACFDGLFLSAALTKVPTGAWFTLLVAAILALVMLLWRFGKHRQWSAERNMQVHDKVFHNAVITKRDGMWLSGGKKAVSGMKGIGIFMDKTGFLYPTVYTRFLRSFEAQHAITIFLNVRYITIPSIENDQRYVITKIEALHNTYRIIARYGYNEAVPENLAEIIKSKLGDYLALAEQPASEPPDGVFAKLETITESTDASPMRMLPDNEITVASTARQRHGRLQVETSSLTSEKTALSSAFEEQVVFLLGKQRLIERRDRNKISKAVLACYTWLREQTTNKVNFLGLPIDQVVEIGSITEI
ncbi:hypothetical protein TWF225_001893 [Orbilia oligospora]|uniref:Uncharacterized protein n=1 Tax=Orbilia oligospora TaxID=2813651 RepID=A0A7C8PUF1_ORBOL|nr:hypothetical protein TWF751_011626 [Orbilia oligospora]KAF3190927.1 hypothetical protein TWF225_001893 [Orbilia oligospora]KAF3262228.1 hypothetical protein TWF217_004295 [Orbilia oligospora]KAF3265280.1 hypothetical protein TWF128_000561 [Orbilia oligospora]KAF3293828.1 hypothetical protein TWF132_004416 [Orbilia oligospora]